MEGHELCGPIRQPRARPPHLQPPGVYSRVSPVWRPRGNDFDLLPPDPQTSGVKRDIGQRERMPEDDVSRERGSSLSVAIPLQAFVENVGGPPHRDDGRALKGLKRGSQRGQHSFEM